jgi:hypothetical protein
MTEEKSEKNNSGQNEAKDSEASYIQRRSQWRSSLDALTYIGHLSRQPELKTRDTDRITGIAVLLASLATILCLLLHQFSGVGLQLTLLCDFFLGLSLIIYVFNRLGILTGMTPRQAILAWQLIRAFCFVGVFITINLALILSFAINATPISTIRPPTFH